MNNVTLSKQSCKKVFNGSTLLRVSLHNEAIKCPNGCNDGACTFEKSTPNSEPIIVNAQENCAGCRVDNQCYPLGYRKDGNYCSDSQKFVNQLNSDITCDNNFECSSNVCVSGKCISPSFIGE